MCVSPIRIAVSERGAIASACHPRGRDFAHAVCVFVRDFGGGDSFVAVVVGAALPPPSIGAIIAASEAGATIVAAIN